MIPIVNRMVGFAYLSTAHLQGFDRYKYRSIDTSPLSKYVMQPFWNACVKLLPLWVAPNALTLTGWTLILSNFLLLSYYDWDYFTTSNDRGIARDPIPQWVWLYCSISHFVGYTLDGIDGKQARRTGSSSPLGELFDHGLDSWGAIFLPMSLMSVLGRGEEWGGNIHIAFAPCVAALGGFYVSHWEKYITGVMYLPWLYDIMQLACTLGYLATCWFGPSLWHFYILPGMNSAHFLKWVLLLGFLGSFPMSLWNIYCHYTETDADESTSDSPPRRLTFSKSLLPWLPFILMTALFWLWVSLSPSDILEAEPRILLFSMGILFSNISCRLIMSQMSNQPCQTFNLLLLPLVISLSLSLLQPQLEKEILYGFFFIVLLAHLHYGVSVVQELCQHFKIYCFSVAKPQ